MLEWDVFNELLGESDDEKFWGFRGDEIPARPQEHIANSSDKTTQAARSLKKTMHCSLCGHNEFRLPFGQRNQPVNDSLLAFL